MSNAKNAQKTTTVATMANAVDLSANVVQAIVGEEVADGVGGEPLTRAQLCDTLAAKTNAYLLNPVQEQ